MDKDHSTREVYPDRIKHIKIESNSFLVVKVGSIDKPPTVVDIQDTQEKFEHALSEKFPDLPIIVSHYDIDVQLYTYNRKVAK